MRPILVTTTATIAGLFALARGIGAGAELRQPLAICVLPGLVTSTIATLELLPALAAAVLGNPKRASLRLLLQSRPEHAASETM